MNRVPSKSELTRKNVTERKPGAINAELEWKHAIQVKVKV